MRSFVGIATSGRDDLVRETLASVAAQTQQPEAIFLSKPHGDAPLTDAPAGLPIVQLWSNQGSCAQRNAILDALSGHSGLLLLIDDDFILHPGYLHAVSSLIASDASVALINGALIADGISGPGLSPAQARKLTDKFQDKNGQIRPRSVVDLEHAYGCNMALNLDLVRELRFDERMPFYGWQEDVDFSVRLKRAGRIVKTDAPAGVHLGAKVGRTSGVRFGYSQVVNPLYLLKKGTMTTKKAAWLISKNLAMNLVNSIRPEPYLDRRGRLRGNALALADVMRGRGRPDRILEL